MALTATQKNDILLHLGYTAKTLVPNSTDYSRIVAARFEGLAPETEIQVANLLADIAAVETKIKASTGRFLVESVGDIKLNSNNEHTLLQAELTRLCRKLARLLDLDMRNGRSISLVV